MCNEWVVEWNIMAQTEDTSVSGRPFMVIDGDGPFCFLRSWGTSGSLSLLSSWHSLVLSGSWRLVQIHREVPYWKHGGQRTPRLCPHPLASEWDWSRTWLLHDVAGHGNGRYFRIFCVMKTSLLEAERTSFTKLMEPTCDSAFLKF